MDDKEKELSEDISPPEERVLPSHLTAEQNFFDQWPFPNHMIPPGIGRDKVGRVIRLATTLCTLSIGLPTEFSIPSYDRLLEAASEYSLIGPVYKLHGFLDELNKFPGIWDYIRTQMVNNSSVYSSSGARRKSDLKSEYVPTPTYAFWLRQRLNTEDSATRAQVLQIFVDQGVSLKLLSELRNEPNIEITRRDAKPEI